MNANPPENQNTYDAIVVGAGPAGSTAAYYLAKEKRNVLLLDRQKFPRAKICGDFVGPVAVRELKELGITDNAEFQQTNIIKKAAVFLDGQELIVADMPKLQGLPYEGRVIPRELLDNWIFEAAKKAGANIQENVLVTGFQTDGDGVEVYVKTQEGNRTLRAQLLIGADGTNSLIANQLHGHTVETANRIIGVRTYFKCVTGPQDTADMHFTSESFPGYFWLFPKGDDEANVGVGVLLQTTPKSNPPKELFWQLINSNPAIKERLKNAEFSGKLEAWPINTYDPNMPIVADRVMLVGEAAGLVNAVNGEGIQYALLSGKWAAQTAEECFKTNDFSEKSLSSYSWHVDDEFAEGFGISAFIVQLIRNRNLNPLWLKTFETMVAKAKSDPEYASVAGGILAGVVSPTEGLTPQFMVGTLQEATVANGLRMVEDTLKDPTSLPTAVIKIGETGLQTALGTVQNPFGFLQWSFETAAKMMEVALATSNQMVKATNVAIMEDKSA